MSLQQIANNYRSSQSTTVQKLEQNKNFQVGSNAALGVAVSTATMGLGWGASTLIGAGAGISNDYTNIATRAAANATVQLTQARLDQGVASQKLVTTVASTVKNTYNTVVSSARNSYNNVVNSTWNTMRKLSNPFHW